MPGTRVGKVKYFNMDKGFGFIAPDDSDDYIGEIFVHIKDVMDRGALWEGQTVRYTVAWNYARAQYHATKVAAYVGLPRPPPVPRGELILHAGSNYRSGPRHGHALRASRGERAAGCSRQRPSSPPPRSRSRGRSRKRSASPSSIAVLREHTEALAAQETKLRLCRLFWEEELVLRTHMLEEKEDRQQRRTDRDRSAEDRRQNGKNSHRTRTPRTEAAKRSRSTRGPEATPKAIGARVPKTLAPGPSGADKWTPIREEPEISLRWETPKETQFR